MKARKHAVVRSETEEVDRRIAEARGETEELISKIKSLDAEEEKYDKEKSELGRLLNVVRFLSNCLTMLTKNTTAE